MTLCLMNSRSKTFSSSLELKNKTILTAGGTFKFMMKQVNLSYAKLKLYTQYLFLIIYLEPK